MIKYVFLKRDVVVTSLFFIHIMANDAVNWNHILLIFLYIFFWRAKVQKNDVLWEEKTETEQEISFIFYCLFMARNQMRLYALRRVHLLFCSLLIFFVLIYLNNIKKYNIWWQEIIYCLVGSCYHFVVSNVDIREHTAKQRVFLNIIIINQSFMSLILLAAQ